MFRRALLLLCLAPACAAGEADISRPNFTSAPGIHVEEESSSSTGDASSGTSSTGDVPADVSSSSGEGEASTGAALLDDTTAGDTSTSGSSSTGDVELGTSTGDESSSSSGGGEGSSTGEPPPPAAVCGDGVCEPSERSACWAWENEKWGPGFCFPDCWKSAECVAEIECPCTPEAAAVKNWCYADPLPACAATAPGGLCSKPGGDIPGFYSWHSKCK